LLLSPYRLIYLFLLGVCLCAQAQEAEPAANLLQQNRKDLAQKPQASSGTFLRKGDAQLSSYAVHDSSIGWYGIITPAVSYSFSQHYMADASLSIYPYRLVQNPNPATIAKIPLVTDNGAAGDFQIGLHADFHPRALRSTTTASFTFPTGDSAVGLGAGKFTFDFSDRMEHDFGKTGLLLDIGSGDSSSFVNNLGTQNYNSLGESAHFQAGVVVWLPGRNSIQSMAYEQLPMGHQRVSTQGSPQPPGQQTPPSVSNSLIEDNGFTTIAGIPLSDHVTLSGYYNRSLRHHLETVSVGFTYALRGTPRGRKLSMIDRALREAAGLGE